ncbi:Transmembrane protein 43 [Mizuhopecten yessoensis]|uniref:Transmembrane protein 43 n=1 Tax=Mizuhopecten yessoensis TaxID=6573 RepID=A0A210R4P0_MIZYE|nr:Transmembrane protein 43 [Mizuhopecten yessoensis]
MYRRNYPDDPGLHNMNDRHTRTTYRRNATFLERVGNSCAGILIGIVLLVVASGLLFWNEGRAVQTAQSLDEGLASVVPLDNTNVVFDHNHGKLVHLTGKLKTERVLTDPTYDIAVHSVHLRRTVEMFQWVEHQSKTEHNEGSHTRTETTYSYSQEWRSDLVRSAQFDSEFSHRNPTSMAVKSKTQTAHLVNVGQFQLSPGLVGKISNFRPVEAELIIKPNDPSIHVLDGLFIHSLNPTNPQAGDLRIKFEYAGLSGQSMMGDADSVSIVARQLGSELKGYNTIAGDTLELLYEGALSAKAMFAKEHSTNTVMTWAIRFGGWLLMFVGFGCLTSIVSTLVDWLPIIRELVAAGVTVLNLSMSISLSLTVIAIGWIRYRPLLGISLLALAATPFILSKFRRQHLGTARYP